MSRFKPGDRAAHPEIDSHEGGAKSGIVSDVVGDEKQKMIVVQSEDGIEAFDSRELKAVGKSSASSGPVILKPRHFFHLLRQTRTIVSLALVAAVVLAIIWVGLVLNWSEAGVIFVAGAGLVVALLFLVLIEREYQRRSREE